MELSSLRNNKIKVVTFPTQKKKHTHTRTHTEKVSYTFPFKEAILSTLIYFLIIIKKHFF